MEHIKTVESFFEKLNDHRTLTALFLDLKDESKIKGRVISTGRGTFFRKQTIDSKDYVFIVSERLVNHEKTIDILTQQLTDYLGRTDQKLYSIIFDQLFDKINVYRSQMQPFAEDFTEYKEFRDDTAKLIKSGELDEHYGHDIWYRYCIHQRERERSRLLELLENKIVEIKENIDSATSNQITNSNLFTGNQVSPPETIQWMRRLGVLDFILNTYCKRKENGYNISKAATILNSFVPNISKDNWETKLTAMYGPKGNSAKVRGNDPGDNPGNVEYADRMAKNCKIK